MLPGRGTTGRRRADGAERLVDGAVVAPVEHEDLRAAGDVAGEAQHEAVGVGGGQRELPQRQAEAAGQLAGHPDGVLGGQHGGDAAPAPARSTAVGDGGQGVPGHRAGVARGRSRRTRCRRRRRPGARGPAAKTGKAPGQRVIHAIGTPASRCSPPPRERRRAGWWRRTARASNTKRSGACRRRPQQPSRAVAGSGQEPRPRVDGLG